MEWAEAAVSRLVMEIGQDYTCFSVHNSASNEWMGLEYFQFGPEERNMQPEEIYAVLKEKAERLTLPYREALIFYNFPESLITPAAGHESGMATELINAMFGPAEGCTVISEAIGNSGLFNTYRVPSRLHAQLGLQYRNGRFFHSYTPIVKGFENFTRCLKAVFHKNHFTVALKKGTRFQFIQSFPFQGPEDVVYHLLNVCQRFSADHTEIDLQLSGMIDEQSALYRELYKFFLHTEWQGLPDGYSYNLAFTEHSPQFFSPLFQMAVCVS